MSFRACLVVLSVFLLALVPAVVVPSGALAQQPAAPAPASGATVHGLVTDPDDAVVPGATVTLTPASGKAQTTTSKSDGTYTFRGVSGGTYVVTATAPGFAVFVKEAFHVAANANVTLDTKLAIADFQQQMTVSAESVTLSVDPDNSAATTVITGAALDALSDDPDELSAELSALAGPSAGPGGGQIYIDGFTGGQLPPKSSIREIRINSNPFSAQYDQLGYGRIEIFTKPGTDKFHGNGSFQYQDKFLDTSIPFLGAANSQPDFHTIFMVGSVTGPIRKGMSFTLNGSHRIVAENGISNPTDIYSTGPTSTALCAPGTLPYTACGANPFPTTARAISNPQTRSDVGPRVDLALGAKNTLTAIYRYTQSSSFNNLPGSGAVIDLPSTVTNSSSSESTIQISDTQLLSSKVINETRFEYQHTNGQTTSGTFTPNVSVSGAFVGGGSTVGSINSTPSTHIELQNYTSVQLTKNFIRMGGRLRTTGETESSNSGANGSISYQYLLDPCTQANAPATCVAPSSTNYCSTANMALFSSYQCGNPFQFTQTAINSLTINARETDVGLYAEDDWKARNNLTISLGLRLETENYISSNHDLAPRMSIAYGIPRKNGKTTTVLRGGYGIFYNRYSLGSIANLIQNGGSASQVAAFIAGTAKPAQANEVFSYPGTSCTPTNISACTAGTGTAAGKIEYPVAGSPGANGAIAFPLRSSYIMQAAGTLEQQVTKYASVTATYLNARGEHQDLTRVIPVAVPTSIAASGYAYEQYSASEGVFRQNQLIFSTNVRAPGGVTIFGNYSMNWANSNISSVTNPYVSSYDYGRAGFGIRSRLSLGGTIPLPWHVTASPLIFANSGSPYNITTGVDNNLDGVTDDRPEFLPGMTSGSCTNAATFVSGPKSTTPIGGEVAGYQEIPVNYCTGPANVAVNLRLSRTFGFGPKTDAALAAAARAAAGGDAGGGGRPRGGGGGGLGGGAIGGGGAGGAGGRGGGGGGAGGGGGRGGGGGGANTGRKYNLTIGAQALNLFNEIPYGTPVSSLSNPEFGKSITLQGGQFNSADAVRRLTLQANFTF